MSESKQLQTAQQSDFSALIERVATSDNISADKLEKIIDLQERIFDKNAEIEFNSQMTEVQSNLKPILKDSDNSQTKSTYAKLDLIIKHGSPIWTEHGFALSFGSFQSKLDNHLGISCIVSHKAGHSRTYQIDAPIDMTGIKGSVNKTAIHGFGSSMSYGRRYLTCMIFNIALQDDDDGNAANSAPRLTEEQVLNIKALIKEVGADEERFKNFCLKQVGTREFNMIHANMYDWIINELERKRA